MTIQEKWTKVGLIDKFATNKKEIAYALEITANYVRELRRDSEFTDVDSLVILGMAKLYHGMPAVKEESIEEITEKIKEMYSELEKTHPEIEGLRGWTHIDYEAELLHYVVYRMIEKYSTK